MLLVASKERIERDLTETAIPSISLQVASKERIESDDALGYPKR